MENSFHIYVIRNKINGRVYIGQTTRHFTKRVKEHFWSANQVKNYEMVVSKAIKKYGKESFVCELLDNTARNQEELDALEQKYIKQFNSLVPNGYNVSGGGESFHVPPEEASSKSQAKDKKRSNRFIGVIPRKRAFRAKIARLRKVMHIGSFVSEEEAAKAYDIKALEIYGETARLNFPELLEAYKAGAIKPKETKHSRPKAIIASRPTPSIAEIKDSYVGIERYSEDRWNTKLSYHIYKTPQDAALAYDIEAFAQYGESASLNYPYRVQEYKDGKIIVNSYRAQTRSQYRGVTFHNKKWLAQICINRRAKCIGYFLNEQDAARAYDKRCWELFKDKSRLNFPDEFD